MPTGSLCAERNVIGTALSADITLRREDIKLVAVYAGSMHSTNPLHRIASTNSVTAADRMGQLSRQTSVTFGGGQLSNSTSIDHMVVDSNNGSVSDHTNDYTRRMMRRASSLDSNELDDNYHETASPKRSMSISFKEDTLPTTPVSNNINNHRISEGLTPIDTSGLDDRDSGINDREESGSLPPTPGKGTPSPGRSMGGKSPQLGGKRKIMSISHHLNTTTPTTGTTNATASTANTINEAHKHTKTTTTTSIAPAQESLSIYTGPLNQSALEKQQQQQQQQQHKDHSHHHNNHSNHTNSRSLSRHRTKTVAFTSSSNNLTSLSTYPSESHDEITRLLSKDGAPDMPYLTNTANTSNSYSNLNEDSTTATPRYSNTNDITTINDSINNILPHMTTHHHCVETETITVDRE